MKKISVFLLCFFSGYINILTIFQYSYAISHFSGDFTKISKKLILGQFDISLLIICKLVFLFFLGASFIGYMNEHKERYGYLMIVYGAVIFILLQNKFTGNIFIDVLTFIMGSQNGLDIKIYNSSVRTTHMTGNLTELGIGIGRVLSGEKKLFSKAIFNFLEIIFYIIGGIIGIILYNFINIKSFYVFSIGYSILGVIYIKFKYDNNLT